MQSFGVFTTFPTHFRFTSGGHMSCKHGGCSAHNYVVDHSDGQIGILLAILELFRPTSGSLPVEMRVTSCHKMRLVKTSRMAVFAAQSHHLSPSYTSIPVNFRSFLANGLRWHAPDLRIESHGLENPWAPFIPLLHPLLAAVTERYERTNGRTDERTSRDGITQKTPIHIDPPTGVGDQIWVS